MKFFYSIQEAIDYLPQQSCFIAYRRVIFPIYIDYKGARKWVVFTPGACSRTKPMPVFQRSSYSKAIPYNVISLFDPGLLENRRLTNTWFAGTPARYYAQYIATVLASFFFARSINCPDVLLFGTSAGGLPAMQIAMQLPGCSVFAGNVQTLASRHSAFDRMVPVLFRSYRKEECADKFRSRFDAREMEGDYNLFYFQNISDRFHMLNHYAPYATWYRNSSTVLQAKFYEYDDPSTGHGPLGRAKEIELISQILESRDVDVPWATRR